MWQHALVPTSHAHPCLFVFIKFHWEWRQSELWIITFPTGVPSKVWCRCSGEQLSHPRPSPTQQFNAYLWVVATVWLVVKYLKNRNTYQIFWTLRPGKLIDVSSIKRFSLITQIGFQWCGKTGCNDSGKWVVENDLGRVPEGCGIQTRRGKNQVNKQPLNAYINKLHIYIHTNT